MLRAGYDGRECLLKAICETTQHPLEEHNGVLGDIVHILFTWVFRWPHFALYTEQITLVFFFLILLLIPEIIPFLGQQHRVMKVFRKATIKQYAMVSSASVPAITHDVQREFLNSSHNLRKMRQFWNKVRGIKQIWVVILFHSASYCYRQFY